MSLKNIKIAAKIYLLIFCSFAALLIVSTLLLNKYKESMYDSRKIELVHLVETAHSEIASALKAHKAGHLTLEEAQHKAKQTVKDMRYAGGNYFWINDFNAKMVMHAVKPQLDGKDLSKTTDKHADDDKKTLIFTEMANVGKEKGGGYIDYVWTKPNSEDLGAKISYVKAVPEWQWVVGTGVYIDDIEETFMAELKSVSTIIIAGVLFVGLLGWFILRDLSIPLLRIAGGLKELSDDKVIEVTDNNRKDEIGNMADALVDLNIKLEEARKLAAREEENKRQAEKDRKEMMLQMADDFDLKVGNFISSLASASTELQSSAEGMKDISDKTSESSTAVVSSSGEASANVNTVASAMEEMSASIAEIVTQITAAKTQSNDTASHAENANNTVGNLNELVQNIGEVVVAIQDIAEQTNLLALNATIEAARAGEAGKGFAVVAEEVKKLASETSQKTEEINGRITDIQNATSESVNAMDLIIKNIGDIDTSVTGISAAAEEQNVTTNEIVRSVAEASGGVQQVSHVILDVQKGADETRSSADSVLDAAKEVSELSENLRAAVETFLGTIRDDAGTDPDFVEKESASAEDFLDEAA